MVGIWSPVSDANLHSHLTLAHHPSDSDKRRLTLSIMDFHLTDAFESMRRKVADLVDTDILPLESDPASYDAHENIHPEVLARVRARVRERGLWAPQASAERGGTGTAAGGPCAVL